jgi:hypothetical protein
MLPSRFPVIIKAVLAHGLPWTPYEHTLGGAAAAMPPSLLTEDVLAMVGEFVLHYA